MARRIGILTAIEVAAVLGTAALLVNSVRGSAAGRRSDRPGRRTPHEEPTPVGRTVSDFTVHDTLGKPHRLSEWAESRLIVVALPGHGMSTRRSCTARGWTS